LWLVPFKTTTMFQLMLMISLMMSPEPVPADSPDAVKALHILLDQKDFFRLRTSLNKNNTSISTRETLYFTAFVSNAFNKHQQSIQTIDLLLSQYAQTLNDSLKTKLLLLQEDNYAKTFQYNRASATNQLLLNQYAALLDSTQLADAISSGQMWQTLMDIPPQEVHIKKATSIPWKTDKVRLMNIPVKTNGPAYDFIFDTGASMSTINESFAHKLGLRRIAQGTNPTASAQLAIADSLYIGEVLVQHVVFVVLPDDQLAFPGIDYAINGIIGYPVIAGLKEIQLFQNGTLTIPQQSAESDLNNLALDGLNPIVAFATDQDTLCFEFDTGAHNTDLFYTYLVKHKQAVLQQAQLTTIESASANEAENTTVYILPTFNLQVGDKKVTLHKVKVQARPATGATEKCYGNIGQDFIKNFGEMTLNFEHMYVSFH
jgi:predicted aspartyl protease